MTPVIALALSLLVLPAPVARTTWNEPWHEEVVRDADVLVKVKVLANDGGRRLTLKRERRLAGIDVPPVFVVDGFSKMRIM